MTTATRPVFRQLPYMGVIRVNMEAMQHGFCMSSTDWANLGQGQPEVGAIAGAPPRPEHIGVSIEDCAYGPVEGTTELREAVAAHYNRLYRQGMSSQYTAENVAVASGGRLALSRLGACLDTVRLGYFTPDYTAYEDLMTTFHRIDPIWINLRPEDGFRIDLERLEATIVRAELDAILLSNPCNPTGVAVKGDELKSWLELGRRRGCTILADEFYSHFVYDGSGPVSAASYVENVNDDRVVIVDGLTKCFRYPGWRVGWVVAPKAIIQSMTAAGSFLDGGPSRPIQRAAVDILEPGRADQETDALRTVFNAKRECAQTQLEKLGVTFPVQDSSTFYLFGCIAGLPESINDGQRFMRAGFEHRVLTVPGAYFDVNPKRARGGESPLTQFVRFSFGPTQETLDAGLERITAMVQAAQ